MKFCVKSRQPLSLLRKADEIRVEYRDIEQLLDFFQQLTDKTYLITIPGDNEFDQDFIMMCHEKSNIILEITKIDLSIIKWCAEKNIKWYWSYPITSFYELQAIAAFNPSYLLLGAPMSFSLDKVSKYNIPIRLIANEAGLGYIPTFDGSCGPWIRPEAIPKYEKYVSAIDFVSDNLTQESALFKVYAEDKQFTDNLIILFKHFNINANNYAMADDVDEARLTCGQKCMENNRCKLCPTGIVLAQSVDRLKESFKTPLE